MATTAMLVVLAAIAQAINVQDFEIDANSTVAADALFSGNEGGDDWAQGSSETGVFLGVGQNAGAPGGAGPKLADDCYGSDIYRVAAATGGITLVCDGNSDSKFGAGGNVVYTEVEQNIVSPSGKTPHDVWPIKPGNVRPKNDFSHAYFVFRVADSPCDGDLVANNIFAFLGGHRGDNEGSAFWGFELNQTAPTGLATLAANSGASFNLDFNREVNDVLVSITMNPSDPTTPALDIFQVTGFVSGGSNDGDAIFTQATPGGCDTSVVATNSNQLPDPQAPAGILAPDWNIPVCDKTQENPSNTCRLANEEAAADPFATDTTLGFLEFAEAAVDLLAYGIPAQCFQSGIFTSRSAHPLESADIQDVGGGGLAVCSANISITPSGLNTVAELHTFTVTLTASAFGSPVAVPDGTKPTVTLTAAGGAVVSGKVDNCATTGTVGGSCTVTFRSNSVGTVTGHASANVPVFADSFFVETNGTSGNSGDVVKRFVDAKVAIAPNGLNTVGESHVFTVTVTPSSPTGASVSNVNITPSVVGGTVDSETCVESGASTALTCTITVSSNVVGTATANATAVVTFSDGTNTESVTRTTDGSTTPSGLVNSGPAIKRWVNATIGIAPNDINNVGESHVFTITVTPSAPSGASVSKVNITATLSDESKRVSDTCVESGASVALTCTVTVTSSVATTVTANASAAVTFSDGTNTEVVSPTTNGTGGNSGPATKEWVDGSLRWTKHDNVGQLLGGATFEVCRTHTLDTSTDPDVYVDITDDCFSVTDNSAPDTDSTDGEFLVIDLVLGRYTVRETAAPPGYSIANDQPVAAPDMTLDAPDVEILVAFVNRPPIVKITEFGYTNTPTGTPTSGVVSGTVVYTAKLKNFGGAGTTTTLSGTLKVIPAAMDCPAEADDELDISGSLAPAATLTFTLTCSYSNFADGTLVTATLNVSYTINGFTRVASGSPATISYTVQDD